MEIDSSEAEAYYLFAAILRLMEKFEEAEHFIQSSIKQFPKAQGLLNEHANLLMTLFKFKDSVIQSEVKVFPLPVGITIEALSFFFDSLITALIASC